MMNTETASDSSVSGAAFVPVLTTILGVSAARATAECFRDKSIFYERDKEIDDWFSALQPAQEATVVDICQVQNPEGSSFREKMAAALNVARDTDTAELSRQLKERGYTLTLTAVEQMVERQERGEDVGLLVKNYYRHFAFVEDTNGLVCVLYVYRTKAGWYVYVFRLDDVNSWDAEYRLLLRNSDAQIL